MMLPAGALMMAMAAAAPFTPIRTQDVPRSLFSDGPVCDWEDAAKCRADFLASGAAWRGELNDDGVPELLIRATVLGGTGGNAFFLFQRRGTKWQPLTMQDGWLTIDFPGKDQFSIVPIKRQGYHDIRVGATGCFKWTGVAYAAYDDADFRALDARWVATDSLADAELLWAIAYRGREMILFEPRWFSDTPAQGANVTLEDSVAGVEWWGIFKGGVYGVRDGRSFLLIPRPAYQGVAALKFEGDWLVVQTDKPVARYNRRTHELRLLK